MIKRILDFLSNRIKPEVSINIDELKLLNGTILTKMIDTGKTNIHDIEFKVFSQFGDDGIIQFLIKKIPNIPTTFIEFGVENYQESNTRFLLENNNWSGLIIDGSQGNINFIKKKPEYWKYDITAIASFITRDNINSLIESRFKHEDVGILHIDIDGMDYWIWECININPVLVIMEYNSVFGEKRAITVPYRADFVRVKAHYSTLYAGASLAALAILGKKKGYKLIGCNSAGNNAYFVRDDFSNIFPQKTVEEAFVSSKFRESRDENGNLTYLRGRQRIQILKGLEVFNVETNLIEKI
ncbi:hypothetical protein BCY91_12180 [Pelobium manganitolerans]|uniref:Uncharacterized protein n=1 Tax=Pelobium manganitolerans TaxID=1842495 RepID=A0A419S1P2_9SPHI|nr:hypothetical protein [Pelobium manganitolerans]RKD12401.1 hypothetical protein BCY91_12180 [Pelobium manganitolerans]